MSDHQYLQDQLSHYLDCPARPVVVGYSGGVDSHLLLYYVAKLSQQFSQHQYLAVHVNHGLSENADKWQQHCETICSDLGIACRTIKVEVDNTAVQGLEAAARDARYRALESVTDHNGLILLGQHLDDQLETVFLQLKRGAGPKGLSAMPNAAQRENGVMLVRPFLSVSREQVVALAKQAKLTWIEDESNQDQRFDRNFLRQTIMPKLQQRWPDLAKSVQRSAQLCAEQQMLLEEVASSYLQSLQSDDNALHIGSLLKYSLPWQNQIVRLWLTQQGVPRPSQAVLSELPKLLAAKQDADPKIVFGNYQFRRFRDYLYAIRHYQPIPNKHEYPLDQLQISLPQQLGVVYFTAIPDSLSDGRIFMRSCAMNHKFKPATLPHSKPLKQWFKQWDIPVWRREQSLMLFHNTTCLAVWFDGEMIFSHEAPDELKNNISWQSTPWVL